MGTHSRIGIQLADESILSVYCHWDGYPEWLGRTLKTHYNARSLAEELIDGGDMSSCWTDDRWDDSGVKGVYGPQYYSQRNENCPPRLDADLCEYLLPDGCEEYHYIYTLNNEWVCYDMHQFDNTKLPEVVEIPVPAVV